MVRSTAPLSASTSYVVAFLGQRHLDFCRQQEVLNRLPGGFRRPHDFAPEMPQDELLRLAHGQFVHGDHDIVQRGRPGVASPGHALHPHHGVFIILADELDGLLGLDVFPLSRHSRPEFQVRDQADPQGMADLFRHQAGHQSGDDQPVGREQFGERQLEVGDRAFLFMGERIENRSSARKRACDFAFGQARDGAGGGGDRRVLDQAVPGVIDQLLNDVLVVAIAPAKHGNDGHRDPLSS